MFNKEQRLSAQLTTIGYVYQSGVLQKITLATGASTTINKNCHGVCALGVNNSVLYACDQYGVHSVNVTTGVFTKVADIPDVQAFLAKDADEFYVITENSLGVVTTAGVVTWINHKQ